MSDKYAALRTTLNRAVAELNYPHNSNADFESATRELLRETRGLTDLIELLAERDADKRRIAELGEALERALRANAAQDDHINQQQDRIDTLENRNAELGKYAGKLEVRTLTVKLKSWDEFAIVHMTSCSDDYAKGWVDGRDHGKKQIGVACAATGISLKIEGE